MIKRTINVLLFSLALCCLIGCREDNKEEKDPFWQNFYNEDKVKSAYNIASDATMTKASYGYTLNKEQGHNNWYYLYDTNLESTLTYDEAKAGFVRGDVEMIGESMKAGETSVVRAYKSSLTGKAYIKGNIASCGDELSKFAIYHNETKIYPSGNDLIIEADDYNGFYFDIEVDLLENDIIYFVVTEGKVNCNPTIQYKEYEEILYQVPEWNFWGDVHPFYYNGKMYMYNLEGYLEDVGNERYIWRLHTTTDMFNYEMVDYEVFPFVKNHYNDTLNVYESIFDKVTFPYGSRDMFLFYDEGAQKYIYFGLCYYEDYSSCLGVRVSDDDTGVRWSTPMYSLRDFDFACDPECSQALYINDRWYIITSIWGQSIHSVGRPAYLIGDKGKDFLENDWANKEFHYLDGEDLCAAQIVDVGNGHYLMYGWIPKTSYTNTEDIYFDGTRDHGLWGGNINIPREVYQNEDGTLSTRLDYRVTELLSRGKIYYNSMIDSNSSSTTLGNFNRTFTEFDVELENSTQISYNLESDGKRYKLQLLESEDGVYLAINNVDEVGHPLASMTKIGDELLENYHFKIVVDHSIVEVHVNDKWSLTARIAMFNGYHTASLSSNGKATFKNVEVNKLAYSGDIYD